LWEEFEVDSETLMRQLDARAKGALISQLWHSTDKLIRKRTRARVELHVERGDFDRWNRAGALPELIDESVAEDLNTLFSELSMNRISTLMRLSDKVMQMRGDIQAFAAALAKENPPSKAQIQKLRKLRHA
jgi:hypothetical protein